jgi:DNA-binding transcriptional LysR family regulator
VAIKGSITVNNAETMYELALLGLGVIRLSDIIVGPAIRSGRLVPILLDVHQPEPLPVHAVYTPTRRRPPKVDAVIQFLVEKFASVPWRLPHPPAAPPARRSAPKPRRANEAR